MRARFLLWLYGLGYRWPRWRWMVLVVVYWAERLIGRPMCHRLPGMPGLKTWAWDWSIWALNDPDCYVRRLICSQVDISTRGLKWGHDVRFQLTADARSRLQYTQVIEMRGYEVPPDL